MSMKSIAIGALVVCGILAFVGCSAPPAEEGAHEASEAYRRWRHCVPTTTCAGRGANCGPLSDGCGGTLDCGTCSAGQTCGGGGIANVCGSASGDPGTGGGDAGTSTANHLYVAPTGSDSNPGTKAAPFRTIQRAAGAVVPDTTVHVAPGTYAETITAAVSGTATGRIRFVSDTKWSAKIVPVGAGAYAMWSVKGGYTEIDGFQIDGTGGTGVRLGIYLTGGKSAVRNSWVHDVAQNSGCDNRGGGGLVCDQSRGKAFDDYEFTGNLVHHVGGGCGWIQGIYHSSSGTIENNVVYATSQAINMGHDDHDIDVSNNTLFGNYGYGVYFGGCTEAYNNGCPTTGINIHNNIIYDNGGGVQGPTSANDVGNTVRNNLVYANKNNFDLASPSNSTRTGEVNAPPEFVSYLRAGGGDYHLKSTSPAIDKGASTYAPSSDFDGKPRPYGAGIDIGAYEWRP